MVFEVSSVHDLDRVALIIKEKSENIRIFCLNGDLGAGKTTLVKSIASLFHVVDTVSSPTFSLINEYETATGDIIYHFDFYRLRDEQEAIDIGIEEYFLSDKICLIEWSNMFPDLIPEKHLEINIKLANENRREVTLEEHG